MNCREFSPCSQGLWHCTGETWPGFAPAGREGRQFHLLQKATETFLAELHTDRTGQIPMDSISTTFNTDTRTQTSPQTQGASGIHCCPLGEKVTVPALPGGEGTGKPQMSPHHPTEVFPQCWAVDVQSVGTQAHSKRLFQDRHRGILGVSSSPWAPWMYPGGFQLSWPPWMLG